MRTRTFFTLENSIHCFGTNVKTLIATSSNSHVNVGDDVMHAQSFNMMQSNSSRRSRSENLKLPNILQLTDHPIHEVSNTDNLLNALKMHLILQVKILELKNVSPKDMEN